MKKSVICKNLEKSLLFKDFENSQEKTETWGRIGWKRKSAFNSKALLL
jgi:hypothetical protein